MNISEKLRAALKETGLKYKKIEELTRIPAGTIQQYCSGRPIPADRLKLICLTTGIDEKIFANDDRDFLQREAM